MYINSPEQCKVELQSAIENAMNSAHHLYARLWRLERVIGADDDVGIADNAIAHANTIAAHLVAQHQADCDRLLARFEQLARDLYARPVG